jgi:hypothetical protein
MCVCGVALQAGSPRWRRVFIALILLLDSTQLCFTCGHRRTLPSKDKNDERVRETAMQIRDRERRYKSEIGASRNTGRGTRIQRNKKEEALWTETERDD